MIFRRYRPEDKAAVIATLQASFGGWHGGQSNDYFEWKFERNPHGRAWIWVGDDDGTIAGCYVWNPVRLRVGKTTILGAQSVDAAVHPDYQRRGLFTDLARAATEDSEGLRLVYAFPTEGAFRGQVQVGFRSLFAVPKVYRPLPTRPLKRPRVDDLALCDVKEFDPRFDVFRTAGRDAEIAIERDADYLRWRYAEHPVQQYEILACESGGDVCGYCVLRIGTTRRWARPGYIVDLQVVPAAAPAAAFLVFHALRRLRSLGSRVAVSWMRPSGPEQEALEKFGLSHRYDAIRRRLERPRYVDQFIVFEPDVASPRQSVGRLVSPAAPRWSLVPGDADYQ